MKIAILQPFIPHYREDFFKGLNDNFLLEIYTYENKKQINSSNFKEGNFNTKKIRKINLGPFLIYNPLPFFSKKHRKLVLMLHFGHLTTWLLLVTKFIHKKEIILWGQGISVKRYLKEEKSPFILLKWMIYLADSVWFYTEKELIQWQGVFPNKKMIALNNTISNVERIVNYKSQKSKQELKSQYSINNKICFIFCARFNNNFRRPDLLIQIIERINELKYGFIIIGSGAAKPDFSSYKNVIDFGAVYDEKIKKELFSIADLYIQPGWVGLSIVEAMAYGKPIVTFKRSEKILQCVEYSYLKNGYNSLIFENIDKLISKLDNIHNDEIKKLGINAKKYVEKNLLMKKMIDKASECL